MRFVPTNGCSVFSLKGVKSHACFYAHAHLPIPTCANRALMPCIKRAMVGELYGPWHSFASSTLGFKPSLLIAL